MYIFLYLIKSDASTKSSIKKLTNIKTSEKYFQYNDSIQIAVICYELGSYTMIGYKINDSINQNVYNVYVVATQIGNYITTWKYTNNVASGCYCTFDILYYI